MFLRFVLIFLCVLLPVNIFGKPPDINEIITNVQTQYKGLVSFDIGVNFPSINASTIVYRYVQKGSDVRILWGKNINGTVDCFMYGRVTNGKVIEDAPIIPLILEDFINLDKELDSMGIEKDNIYFDYVDHIPCFVIGGLDKIYVDIENFAIRKRVAHGKEYIFRDFVHIGNYFLPNRVEIKCGENKYSGEILWNGINSGQEIEKIDLKNKKKGGPVPKQMPPFFKCLPMASSFFK
ncbi:hypothetical protein JCM13304A_12820 [Desulfothermus okinawensis JCM 13304]